MPETKLTYRPGGPLFVEGEFELLDGNGDPVGPQGGRIALCRCGHTANSPFCDGTHARIGFEQ